MPNSLERIKEYINYKGISIRAFEMSCGFSNGSFASQLKRKKTIGVDKLENILNQYPDLSPKWVLSGKGEMIEIVEGNDILNEPNENYITISADLIKTKNETIAILQREIEDLKRDKEFLQKIIDNK